MIEKVLHFTAACAAAAALILAPCARYLGLFGARVDAVSGASLAVPDQPSGEFVVLLNKARHDGTSDDWADFFGGEYAVIFDDISCITPIGDEAAAELADRYRIQLPENQMTTRQEDPTLLVSKAEAGLFDVVIMSRDLADGLSLDEDIDGTVRVIVGST